MMGMRSYCLLLGTGFLTFILPCATGEDEGFPPAEGVFTPEQAAGLLGIEAGDFPGSKCYVICVAVVGNEVRTIQAPHPRAGRGPVDIDWEVREAIIDYAVQGELDGLIEIRHVMPSGISSGLTLHRFATGDRVLLMLESPQGDDPAYVLADNPCYKVRLADTRPALCLDGSESIQSLISAEFAAALRDGDAQSMHEVMDSLAPALFSQDIRTALWDLAASGDSWVSIHAVCALTKKRDKDAFNALTQRIEENDYPPTAVSPLGYGLPVTSWILGALDLMGRERELGPAFIRLARSPDVAARFRTRALTRLTSIPSDEKVPVYVDLLDDPDPSVQFHAVQGLYHAHCQDPFIEEAEGGYFPGTQREYEADRDTYLTFWRTWWENEGRERYADLLDKK